MNIEKLFSFLIVDYGFSFKHQVFENCYGRNLVVETFSFYNNSGCFTIYFEVQRGGMDFYCASKFSKEHKELCEKPVDIFKIEPDFWKKRGYKWPFYWMSDKKILITLADVLKIHLVKNKTLFDIEINK